MRNSTCALALRPHEWETVLSRMLKLGPSTPSTADLASQLIETAKALGLTIVTAESCTAGRLATLLADAPGAGSLFHGGFVTYTKTSKSVSLGVPTHLLRECTAVSRPVAEAMAKGALERSRAEIAIAITGVAGPECDEDGNPVGEMHFAIARRDRAVVYVHRSLGDGPPEELRQCVLVEALAMAIRLLEFEGSQFAAEAVDRS